MSNKLVNLVAMHTVVNNAPQIVSVLAGAPPLAIRVFRGLGAPSSSALGAGNGKFCGQNNGYVVAATLQAAGSGYAIGNVLTASGGTVVTAIQFTVDDVTSAGGIVDFHVSRVGDYSAYPTAAVGVSGGGGTGATFNLCLQPADRYIDETAAPVEYLCITRGSRADAVWQKLSGGGIYKKWDKTLSWAAGDLVFVTPDDDLCDVAGMGTVDPDSGLTVFATPGNYVVQQSVAPVLNPEDLPAGTYYRIPQWPPPQTSAPADGMSFNPEDVKVYFWLISNPPCF